MAPSPTARRLLKETSELSASSKNPNPAFHAAPVSDADLHEWHFTLLGPPAPSPYAGGLYHGRISLPPSYPLKPPNFRFLTPSGRFEVNREICLSISGFHEETWMPAWGVRTALTALRSFMAESGTAGQVGGLEASKDVRERLAKESRGWRCKECGGRTNEEIMSEWWAACATRGVKVGEDVGLEVLPEGLSLEAKVPGAAQADKVKGKEAAIHEEVVNATTQAILHNHAEGDGSRDQNADSTSNTTLSSAQPPDPSKNSSATVESSTLPVAASAPNPQPSTQTSPLSQSQLQPVSPALSMPSNVSTRPIPPGLRQLPIVPPPPLARQRQEEQNTITLDRAIYVVFVALCIMVLKKIFYPASSHGDWDDYTVIRE